jgi:arylsulfatase A-like enzyme
MKIATIISAVVLLAVGVHADGAPRRPNVVVFLADDLGARDLGYCGSTFYESPNINALAAKGMIFTNAYAACPVCSPTRAALMTGRYPARTGVTDYIGGPQPGVAATQPKYNDRLLPAPYSENLPPEQVTLAEVLHDAGYVTLCAGKWHLGGKKFPPTKQGFDDAFDFPHTSDAEEYPGLKLAKASAEWLAKQSAAKKPFFLYYASHDPHIPLLPPRSAVEYFQAKRDKLALTDEFGRDGKSKVRLTQADPVYAAVIKMLDDAVGIVMAELAKQNLLDNTIIVFVSDNGGVSTSEGWPTSNAPLRAGKGWPYEGGVRVPMIAIIPGVTRAASHFDTRAITIDVYPTVLAACGVAQPEHAIDGINLLPALRGEKLPDRPLFWHYPHYGNQGGSPFSAVRAGDWKLIVFHDARQGVELYDLSSDPGEKHDLAPKRPEKVLALRHVLDEWKKSVGAIDASKNDG